MTRKDTAWEKQTAAQLVMDAIKYTTQTQPWAVSSQFTGCAALRDESAKIAHVQPATTTLGKLAVSEQSSTLAKQSTSIQRAALMFSTE